MIMTNRELEDLINELDLDPVNLEKIEWMRILYMDLREQYVAETDEAGLCVVSVWKFPVRLT